MAVVTLQINQTNVEALLPTSREYTVWDEALRGFGVRVQPSGHKAYILKYRVGGGRRAAQRKQTLGSVNVLSADKARKAAKQVLAAVELGGDPQGDKARKRRESTFGDLLDSFFTERAADYKPSTWKAMGAQLERNARLAFGDMKLTDLTRAELRDWHSKLKVRGLYGANRCLAYVSTVLSWAVELELLTVNPAKGIKRGGEQKRSRYLDDDELVALGKGLTWLSDANPDAQATALAVYIALYTGCRPGEALQLRWSDYDTRRGVIVIPNHKTDRRGTERILPVSSALRTILKRSPRRGEWIVAGADPTRLLSYNVLGQWWSKLRTYAGLPGVRLHDLRHTAATHAAAISASAFLVRDLLGHKHIMMASRYVERQTAGVQRLADQLGWRMNASLNRLAFIPVAEAVQQQGPSPEASLTAAAQTFGSTS